MSESVTVTFDTRLTHPESVQKAAYRRINLLVIDISIDDESNKIICAIHPSKEVSTEGLEFQVQEFKKDVLDYQLRHKLKKETEPVRNLILGLAFSRTGLQDSE